MLMITSFVHRLFRLRVWHLPVWLPALLLTAAVRGQSAYDQQWQAPQTVQRIEEGIRQHRMGAATIQLTDAKGKALKNAAVTVEQVRHEFLFGSNIFMLNGYNTPEKNRRYEAVFTQLFNFASAPFYWKDLEPSQGQIRFASNSPAIYRRPPPDAVLAFCQQHNITVKGHTLQWDHPQHSIPAWLPKNEAQIERLSAQRIGQIAQRYGKTIPIWDVVNEVIARKTEVKMPKDFAFKAFKEAEKQFPAGTQLLINETTGAWSPFKGEYTPYYLLIQNLMLRGARIDGIGLQFHLFSEQLTADVVSGKAMTPAQLFEVLDGYGDFNLPLHITEITLPALPKGPEGLANQAKMVRNFYRLWFSHPKVEAITWWNVADGSALPGEDKWMGGLLNEDLTVKPSYEVLNDLLNKEWKTRLSSRTDTSGKLQFKGFYGDYRLTIKTKGKTIQKTIKLSKGGPTDFTVGL